ncbi:MAG: hypothetical protein WDN03_12115 [Rhizomicrobium sp.]
MKIEHDPDVPALQREWLVARLVAALGLVLLLSAAAVMGAAHWSRMPPAPAPAPAAAPPPVVAGGETAVVPVAPSADARRQENIALCTAALAAAQRLGYVPAFATVASDETWNTEVRGRYICLARTDAAKYSLDFDLTCTNLGAGDCISLYSVSQAGGGVLYQRK